MQLQLKRIYDDAEPGDGFRVLVDRLWPRGVSKERAALDEWAKDVAPSAALREAFHHGGLPWEDFVSAYRTELAGNPAVRALRAELAQHPVCTLLFGAHDPQYNQAVILREVLLAE
ncbi:DUF488 domain-containing protein [Microbacterium sp. NPDC055910]|uniref:DUF488 domain-containing protein n=1 Tax=Microbacterium sp. NPDC055910 TaxID=3345659 RepID=UPI0035D9E039